MYVKHLNNYCETSIEDMNVDIWCNDGMAMIAVVLKYHDCIFHESRDISVLVSIYIWYVNDIYDTKHFIVPHLSQMDI